MTNGKTKSGPCLFFLLVVGWVVAPCLSARADEFTDLKRSVQLRAPAIEQLKTEGILREGSGGLLLSAGGELSPARHSLVDSENADRARLFQLIATRTNRSTEEVRSQFTQAAARSSPMAMASPSSSPAPAQAAAAATPARPPATAANTNRPLPLAPGGALPLKALTRPFASIFEQPRGDSPKIRENVPAFNVFYVYQKTGGWYQIGSDNRGHKLGWMREADVVEWKQNLVVAFTHPDGRQPVLMFDRKEPLRKLTDAPQAERTRQATALYSAITRGNLPANFPVRTMEPRRAVQADDQFYLLPITDFETVEMDGREGRVLQLAAATRQRGAVDLTNAAARGNLDAAPDLRSAAARGVKADLVFVMDLTRSMEPFAARTLEMINGSVRRLGLDHEVVDAVRFGFWGYRDDPVLCRGIEWNTHNFTPQLQTLTDFARTMTGVHETKIDSIDYCEDVFAGVADAIGQTAWRPDALHLLVLVGDAPGRGPKELDPFWRGANAPVGTASNLNAESLRQLANQSHVFVTGLYLKTPEWKQYAPIGERQFRTLARNPNTRPGGENFLMVNARDASSYGRVADSLAQGIIDQIRASQGRGGAEVPIPDAAGSGADFAGNDQAAGASLARNMFRGAMIEWLGKQDPATVPRDVTVWASDKDLDDPAIQSLDVRVFLTKSELNSLKLMVNEVLDAGTRGKITGEDFFKALQAVTAAAARDASKVQNASTLVQTGLVPEFLAGLPYHSTLMDMNDDTWRNMSPDAQEQFLRNVDSKLAYYQQVHDRPANWQALNEGDDRDAWVAAVPLEELP